MDRGLRGSGDDGEFATDLARRLESAEQTARERQRHEGASAGYRAARTDDQIDAARAEDLAAVLTMGARRAEVERERGIRYQRLFWSVLFVLLVLVGLVVWLVLSK